MKKKSKKILSILLAFIICVGCIPLTMINARASDVAKTYLLDLPRNNDSNQLGWGHPDLQFTAIWSTKAKNHWSAIALDDFNGKTAYCIEPGVPLNIEDSLTQKDESFWDNYPNNLNTKLKATHIKAYIGRIMQYGWLGNNNPNWNTSVAKDRQEMAEMIATQLLIWETVVGERDYLFRHLEPENYFTKYNAIWDMIASDHPLRAEIKNHYDRIQKAVYDHIALPASFQANQNEAKKYKLEWDGEKYSITLTSLSNNFLDFQYTSDNPDVSFNVTNGKLTISMVNAPTGDVLIKANRKESYRKGVVVWTDGNISAKPTGQLQDTVTYGTDVEDPFIGYVKVKVDYGTMSLKKTSEDDVVEGITFRVEGNGIDRTLTTDHNGNLLVENLSAGVYTVTEQGSDRYEPQESQRVTIIGGQTSQVTFNNTLKRGNLTVTKTAEDGLTEGISFRLSGRALNGYWVDCYAVTNENGIAHFNDILISGETPYTLEELNTADRYVIPPQQNVTINWNKVTGKTFDNILKKFNLTVTKSDKEMGNAQGEASLTGAVYGLFYNGTKIDTYTTDSKGQFTTKEYVCGDGWTLRELSSSEGYLLDQTVYKVGAQAGNFTIERNSILSDVKEQVIKGKIAVIKHCDDGSTQIETPEVGAVFQVYSSSANSFEDSKVNERDTLICDENGYAVTQSLPYGLYTVHQVSGWEGREKIDDFEVFINQDGKVYQYLINNSVFTSLVEIIKLDIETGKIIPTAGVGFKVRDLTTGKFIVQHVNYPTPIEIDTYYTDVSGKLIMPQSLSIGKYEIIEQQTAHGYVLDSTPVKFEIDGTEKVVTVGKYNKPQKGTISVIKSGEKFSSVNETNGIFQPVYAVNGLLNATYEITAAEDIITLDGTLRVAKGEIVDTITTDKSGLAKSKQLYLGKYTVKEIKAPDGMVRSNEIREVTMNYAGQEVEVTGLETTFVNERQKVKIDLVKELEQDEHFNIGTNSELFDVNFGLYAAEDLQALDGKLIPADGLIEIISVDENGYGYCLTDLPFGSYYIKELSTNSAYIPSETKYPIEFEYGGQDIPIVNITANNEAPIKNKIIRGKITGLKIDEDGLLLSNALIGLFKSDETNFNKENALSTAISDFSGCFDFKEIPYGDYLIKEIEQPTGYVLSNTIFPVAITSEDQIIDVTINNNFVTGTIQLKKVDKEKPNDILIDAEFAVYSDSNNNKVFDDGDVLIGTLENLNTGIYNMSNLRYGGYFIKEITAPIGFKIDENAYYAFIEKNGETVTIENESGKDFTNEAQKGSLKINKTSSDGVLQGFKFKVVGITLTGEKFEQIFITDENGEIILENLRVGNYTISEILDGDVDLSYELPADQTVTIEDGQTATINFYNQRISKVVEKPNEPDVPQTGDNTPVRLCIAIAVTSALSVLVVVFYRIKNKKKKEK